MMKLKEVKQPTRKKLWWLLFLIPIIYVIVDNLIFPIDGSALLKRTTIVEMGDEMTVEDYPGAPSTPRIEPGNGGNGWVIFDRILLRVNRAWPLILSLLPFIFRRKIVGDPK